MSLGIDRNGIAVRIARSLDSNNNSPSPLRRSHAIRVRTRASMTGVAYVIVVKRVAMGQANLAGVTVAARVAAVATNVSSGSRAVANRSNIIPMADVSWPSMGSELRKPKFAEPALRCLCCPSNWLELSLSVAVEWRNS